MKTINIEIVNEKLYYEKLDNGLEIYLIRKKDFITSHAVFLTNFGGLDTSFIPINEKDMITVPSGIAHFLEHKLFEQEEGDKVFDFYKKTGSYVNATTGYKDTRFFFNSSKNFKENLSFLLDFVQKPYFTDENVEKEKGIILEEAMMSLDNPNRKFGQSIYHSLYNSLPYNNTVIGSLEDIKSITKEDLYKCYNSFYHPSNMVLFIVTNEDVKEIIDLVKDNQNKKKFDNSFKIIKKKYYEEEKVNKEREVLKEDVNENRLCYSIKMKADLFKASKIEIYDYYCTLFEILLGSLSSFNMDLKNKRIIKDNISYTISSDETENGLYIIFNIYALTDKYDRFINILEKKLLSKDYTKEDFELYTKTFKTDLISCFNVPSGIMRFMLSEYMFSKKVGNDNIIAENNLSYKRFKEVTDKLNLDNKSIVILEKKK